MIADAHFMEVIVDPDFFALQQGQEVETTFPVIGTFFDGETWTWLIVFEYEEGDQRLVSMGSTFFKGLRLAPEIDARSKPLSLIIASYLDGRLEASEALNKIIYSLGRDPTVTGWDEPRTIG